MLQLLLPREREGPSSGTVDPIGREEGSGVAREDEPRGTDPEFEFIACHISLPEGPERLGRKNRRISYILAQRGKNNIYVFWHQSANAKEVHTVFKKKCRWHAPVVFVLGSSARGGKKQLAGSRVRGREGREKRGSLCARERMKTVYYYSTVY